jgi:hypothetical protein
MGKNLASVALLLIIIAATSASWVRRARARAVDRARRASLGLTSGAAG